MSNAKNLALPIVGILVVAAWFVFRPAVEDTAAPPAAAPQDGARDRDDRGRPGRPGPDGSAAPGRPEPPPKTTVRDAKRSESVRAALRDRIRRNDRDAPSGQDPARGSDLADDAEDVGTLDKQWIQDRIREDLVPLAKECYASALEDDPELAGKIVMTFGIAGDEEVGGVVDEAAVDPSSTIRHAELGECMRESMLSLTFPAPEGGGRVAVTYPFVFEPGEPAAK